MNYESTSARLDVNSENTLEVNCPLIFRLETKGSVHSGGIDRQQLYLNSPLILEGVELFLEPTGSFSLLLRWLLSSFYL
jgi:hypothetical protein